MATIITEDCINCGACEPECPNTAIYQGGVEWEFNGAQHPAIDEDIFYIVPDKCTECVGFFDQEACAAVCPVDCCLPNPDIVGDRRSVTGAGQGVASPSKRLARISRRASKGTVETLLWSPPRRRPQMARLNLLHPQHPWQLLLR